MSGVEDLAIASLTAGILPLWGRREGQGAIAQSDRILTMLFRTYS
ncbi:hypothetical protein [Spirulina major]|nr:hypothetical protein [Spirulina major]